MIGGSHSLYSEDLEVDLADDGQMSLVSVLGYIGILFNSINILALSQRRTCRPPPPQM